MAPFAIYIISTMQAQDSTFPHQTSVRLVTVVSAIAIGVASGDVAVEHSVLRPIVQIIRERRYHLCHYFHKIVVPVNSKHALRYVIVMTQIAMGSQLVRQHGCPVQCRLWHSPVCVNHAPLGLQQGPVDQPSLFDANRFNVTIIVSSL